MDTEKETKHSEMPAEEEQKETKDKKETKSEKNKEKKDKKAEEIKALKEKLDSQKDNYMRLAAEYDNYRKRTAAEKLSIYDDATAKAVTELLPVADSLQMALQNMENAPKEFKKGIELVNSQLEACFEKLHIEAFGAEGDDFDPQFHNAVSKIESESYGESKLSQIFQKGYKIGDKVIRHAMVQVANCD